MLQKISVLAALAIGGAACGASIQAVYEGDVRFEHCMALDSRPDVKPTIRRACWDEWQDFYTFGQTRDRVEYARLRSRQLSTASDFDEGDWTPPRAAIAVPEPTSVFAPPPMILVQSDGGVPSADDGGLAADASDRIARAGPDASAEPLPSSDCASACAADLQECRGDCKNTACEKVCTGKYRRCMRRCF